MYLPKGIIPALATPFNNDKTINYKAYYEYLDYLIEEGVHGLLIGGTTAEYTLLNDKDRKELIKNSVDYINNRVPIVVGTSCHKTEDTITLTQYAATVGASAALILPPYYLQTTRKGIVDYYKEISNNTNISIMIYHFPNITGVTLDTNLIYELSQIENVVSLKNTTNFVSTSKAIDATKDNPEFTVLTGMQDLVLPTIAVGGDGAMCVIPGLIPKEILNIYNFITQENDIKKASMLNKELISLYTLVDSQPFPGNVKSGLEVLGRCKNIVQHPLEPGGDEAKNKIGKELKKLGYNVNLEI